MALYVQDDWRWRPNLTLNLGLRYEMATVPTEAQGRLTTLINISDTDPHLGNPYFLNPTRRNFEPRVGFSWDPFRNGKTAVRGGFGIFDVLPLPYEFMTIVANAAPYALGGTVKKNIAGQFYDGAYALLKANALQQTYVEHQPHRNYVMQWNLNVQRQLTPNLTALVGYVGSRGVHQPFRADDVNVVLPTSTSAGYLWPCGPDGLPPDGTGNPCATGFLPTGTMDSPIPSSTINPDNGTVRGVMWSGGSSYHALDVGITRTMSHGLRVQGSYTFSKSIDTSSATLVGDAFGNSVSSLHWFDLKLGRGLSDFDIRRVLVINATWQVPTFKSASGPLAWAANGWELGAIYKANDGVPFTATFGTDGDPLGLGSNDTYDFPDRLTTSGCATLTNPGNPNNYIKTQCFAVPTAPSDAFYAANCDQSQGTSPQCFNLRGNAGRNILIGPGLSNLDFSVVKNTYVKRISETFNAQFRAEIFNILNRANFALPPFPNNTDIFDSSGTLNPSAGELRSTTTPAREIQFALKFTW